MTVHEAPPLKAHTQDICSVWLTSSCCMWLTCLHNLNTVFMRGIFNWGGGGMAPEIFQGICLSDQDTICRA